MPDDLGDGGLFEVDPAQRVDAHSGASKPLVDKTFRWFEPDQGLLLLPSLDDWLPAEHLARFIADLVDGHLDLSRIAAAYTESRGGPPYDPRLMVRILLYGYTTGVRSLRKLEAACVDVVAFRWLAAGSAPDYRAIARFRKRHLSPESASRALTLRPPGVPLALLSGERRINTTTLRGTDRPDEPVTDQGSLVEEEHRVENVTTRARHGHPMFAHRSRVGLPLCKVLSPPLHSLIFNLITLQSRSIAPCS